MLYIAGFSYDRTVHRHYKINASIITWVMQLALVINAVRQKCYAEYHVDINVSIFCSSSWMTWLKLRRIYEVTAILLNSHIWQSLSSRDWRWKAAVTLGWMGATFSGSGSWPPCGTAIATRADRWEYRWCGKFTWIAALQQHFIFFL